MLVRGYRPWPRAMSDGRRKQVGGFCFKAVALADGEFVSKDATAHHWRGKWTSSLGRLYLTNLRLVFCGLPVLMIWRFGIPWPWGSLSMNLDDILLVAPAANIPNHFLESAYRVDLQDRTEIFGMVSAPHQQWLMEIKATIPPQEHSAGR